MLFLEKKNGQFGVRRFWMTNGEINCTVKQEDIPKKIEIGFRFGRIKSEKVLEFERRSKGKKKGKKLGIWMSNGIDSVRVKTEEEILKYESIGYKRNKRNYSPSEETRRKISESFRGEKNPKFGKSVPRDIVEKTIKIKKENGTIKPIEQLNKVNGDVLNTFDSVSDASRCIINYNENLKLSTVIGGIYAACTGIQKTAYGYKWRFVENA